MSAHTGASALLALLMVPEADPASLDQVAMLGSVLRARKSLRNAIRRLVRAHGGRIGPAAAAVGVSKAALRAAADAVGLRLLGRPGNPGRSTPVARDP